MHNLGLGAFSTGGRSGDRLRDNEVPGSLSSVILESIGTDRLYHTGAIRLHSNIGA